MAAQHLICHKHMFAQHAICHRHIVARSSPPLSLLETHDFPAQSSQDLQALCNAKTVHAAMVRGSAVATMVLDATTHKTMPAAPDKLQNSAWTDRASDNCIYEIRVWNFHIRRSSCH